MGSGLKDKAQSMSVCAFCGGHLTFGQASQVYEFKNRLNNIKHLLGRGCQSCGKAFFTAEVVDNLAEIVDRIKKPGSKTVIIKSYLNICVVHPNVRFFESSRFGKSLVGYLTQKNLDDTGCRQVIAQMKAGRHTDANQHFIKLSRLEQLGIYVNPASDPKPEPRGKILIYAYLTFLSIF